jgi:hypothetical protein
LVNISKLDEQVVRVALWRIAQKYPQLTPNATAQIFALKKNSTVLKYLDAEDRQALGNIELKRIEIPIKMPRNQVIIKFANYETKDSLLAKHIEEINKTYTFKCYTATFILCRKVLENLIIYEILKKKYPQKTMEHRKKYFDFDNNRNFDFSILLAKLRKSANDFAPENKLVERICQLSEGFKEDANEMTHSLFHIASKTEIDEKGFQVILDLIKSLRDEIEKQPS